MAESEMRTFDDFWPFYVREHSNKANRMLHFVGTTLAMGSVAAGVITGKKAFFLAAPVVGYGFAWIGHFLVEGNRPATFKYPAWSLRGDFVMWGKIVAGKMDEEVERAHAAVKGGAGNGVHEAPVTQATPVSPVAN